MGVQKMENKTPQQLWNDAKKTYDLMMYHAKDLEYKLAWLEMKIQEVKDATDNAKNN